MRKPTTAMSVAKYFLSLADEEVGDLISNLKLQKLLYYAQGCWIAIHGADNPLFKDTIYAWKHGPVVKTVYDQYSRFGGSALPVETAPRLPAEEAAFLDEIYRVFGRFSAWKLREMTHREAPWRDAYVPDVQNVVIPPAAMEKYFSKHVKKEK